MGIRDRLIKGTALNFVAVAFNQGSTFIVNVIVARILLKQSFGEYAMIQSTLVMAAALSQLSMGYTASKYVAEYRSVDPERAGRVMGLCAIVAALTAAAGAILMVSLAPWLAGSVLKAPRLAPALVIGAGFLFFSALNGYQTGALSGLEAFGSLAKAGVVSGIMAVLIISLGTWWGGLNGSLMGLSLSALLRCAIHNVWLRVECRRQRIRPRYSGALRREKAIVTRFAVPAAVAGYFSIPMVWLANSFLVRQPGGFGEMALYGAANNVRLLALFLPNVMNSVGLSVLNHEMSKGVRPQYHAVFRNNVLAIFLVSLAGVLFLGLFAKPVLLLFGKDFAPGRRILQLLLISTVFEGLSIGLYQYLQSRARIWLSLISINVPRELTLVAAAYFLVKPNGGVGLAQAYLAATVLGTILHFALVVRLYGRPGAPALPAAPDIVGGL